MLARSALCQGTKAGSLISIPACRRLRDMRTPGSNVEHAMTLFFFDIEDGQLIADDTGSKFPNAHAARDAAIKVL
ncbi:DUF6894 family protein, partial [Methylobacterium frigidaeris]|uniref:DUF6894 family protein n=1 Tax=Methylobacterium frigidaeris TaxID=2038277 RepID=UPI003CC82D1A